MTEHMCSVLGKLNTERFVTKDNATHIGWVTSQETSETNTRTYMRTRREESTETQDSHASAGLHLHMRASFRCALSPVPGTQEGQKGFLRASSRAPLRADPRLTYGDFHLEIIQTVDLEGTEDHLYKSGAFSRWRELRGASGGYSWQIV